MTKRAAGSEEHAEWVGVGGTKQRGERCASRREPVTRTMSDSHEGLLGGKKEQNSEEGAKQPARH